MSYSAIVLGATGNVGGSLVRHLVASPLCSKVVVITRRHTGAFTDPKVSEVVVDMNHLEEQVAPHAKGVDVALAAFGVGKGSASMSRDDVRRIEVAYPHAFCQAARSSGVRVCGVMSAIGANPTSRVTYTRILGEKEQAVTSVGFDFLGLYRPAVILGNSNTPGALGSLMPWLHWALPARYHSIHKDDVAGAMVARSERAWQALSHGDTASQPVVEVLEYPQMQPFFAAVPGSVR